ncbi:MAG TPA: hypothetical protein VM598_06770, partial [Bdellovibrionota bacterium]|nr:hypothetical protein [Bdellovibrionota bacterium]
MSEIPIFKAKIDAHKNDTSTPDEAMQAWREGKLTDRERDQLWNGSDEDHFHDMDYGITRPENREKLRLSLDPFFKGISADEAVRRTARGRNNWVVWTGGNDRFWDQMSLGTMGTFDLLKTISNDPARVPTVRSNRWDKIGLVNEPGFVENRDYDITRFGLKLDKRVAAPDPYENADKYPGVKIGGRGEAVTWCAPPGEWKDDGSCKDAQGRDRGPGGQRYLRRDRLETGSYYGYATGVVGLRLFPNPAFTDAAARKWNPRRYYEEPAYYNDPALVKPFRVGMACAFCHVGPNPTRPPADFNAPKFENLTSNAGAQYFWTDRIFFWNWEKEGGDNIVYQLLRTYRPGALDTSLISSDNINNPRTMNAVYDFPARMMTAAKLGHWERLTGEEKFNKQFDTVPNYITKSSP